MYRCRRPLIWLQTRRKAVPAAAWIQLNSRFLQEMDPDPTARSWRVFPTLLSRQWNNFFASLTLRVVVKSTLKTLQKIGPQMVQGQFYLPTLFLRSRRSLLLTVIWHLKGINQLYIPIYQVSIQRIFFRFCAGLKIAILRHSAQRHRQIDSSEVRPRELSLKVDFNDFNCRKTVIIVRMLLLRQFHEQVVCQICWTALSLMEKKKMEIIRWNWHLLHQHPANLALV